MPARACWWSTREGAGGGVRPPRARRRRRGSSRRLRRPRRRRARAKTMRNHSATHLMHKALREVLGGTCSRRARWSPERTRFDFAHNAPMTTTQIRGRGHRQRRDPRQCRHAGARDGHRRGAEAGAMMLFGEKYGDRCACSTSAAAASCAAARTSAHRRHRRVQDRRRGGRGRGRAPRRGGDRRQRAGLQVQSLEGTVNAIAGTLKAASDRRGAGAPACSSR